MGFDLSDVQRLLKDSAERLVEGWYGDIESRKAYWLWRRQSESCGTRRPI
jgi:hypothetical protein